MKETYSSFFPCQSGRRTGLVIIAALAHAACYRAAHAIR